MTSGKLVKGFSLLAALLAPAAALAQSAPAALPGFELERLELNPDGQGSLLLGTGQLMEAGQLRASVLAHYERAPLAYYIGARPAGFVVKDRTTAELTAAWAPLSWLELAAQVPVVFDQSGDDLTSRGIAPVAKSGLDTPIASLRVGLLSQRAGGPLDLALELGVGLPLGSAAALGREPGVRYTPRLMLGRELGFLRVGAEVGAQLRPTVTLTPSAPSIRDEVGGRLVGGVALSTTGEGLRGELDVFGDFPLSREAGALEAMLGLRLPLGSVAEVFAMGGTGVGSSPGVPRFRALVGVAFGGRPPAASQEAPKEVAKAPPPQETPKEAPKEVAKAPPPQETPKEAPKEVAKAPPPQETPKEAPQEVAKAPPPQETPKEVAKTPPPQKTPKEEQPQKPPAAAVVPDRIVIKNKVLFDTGNARIRPRSFALLNQIVKLLQEHPEIELVHIDGHTDNEGDAEWNRKLSQTRAEAVRRYLIDHGVQANRLDARGYGADQPIDDNKTARGRANNRRVEFLISTDETDKGDRR